MTLPCDVVLRGAAINAVGDQANNVESLGFAGVGVTETTGNPFLAAAQAAQATSTVQVTTAIALAFPRTPMDVAYTAWDLQALSSGRFALGLGTQVRAHVERRYGAVWSKPAARMREYVLALHAIWDAWESGEPLNFEGEFYRHTLMPPNFRPAPLEWGRPPVLLAAVRERMTEVVGEVGDGLLSHAFCTQDVLSELTLPAIERGLERSGRSRADVSITASVFVATNEEDWEANRKRIAFYGSTPGYRHVLDHHGLGSTFDALHTCSREGRWAEMPGIVDDDTLGLFVVRGDTPQSIAAEVRKRVGGHADRVALGAEGAEPAAIAPIAAAL
jgi:probable F420-dependent oxidoreductase